MHSDLWRREAVSIFQDCTHLPKHTISLPIQFHQNLYFLLHFYTHVHKAAASPFSTPGVTSTSKEMLPRPGVACATLKRTLLTLCSQAAVWQTFLPTHPPPLGSKSAERQPLRAQASLPICIFLCRLKCQKLHSAAVWQQMAKTVSGGWSIFLATEPEGRSILVNIVWF